jgi:hypothetical protein
MLSRFGMLDCRPQSVPADPSAKLVPISASVAPAGGTYPFKEAVGSLMYGANTTRPDIKYAVGQVAKFAQNPSPAHWSAVKHILSYLKGTFDYGIRFSGSSSSGVLSAYSDADYAGCLQTRRSTTGYVLLLNGGPVAWTSRRQQGVATSTTESEYTARRPRRPCEFAIFCATLATPNRSQLTFSVTIRAPSKWCTTPNFIQGLSTLMYTFTSSARSRMTRQSASSTSQLTTS